MAVWLPAVKAILPYVTQIVTAVIPVFTKKKDKGRTDEVITSQISELQEAVTHNAESLKILATQLQQVISGIDTGADKIEQEIKIIKRLSIFAIAISVFAIILWLASWLH
jgi:hypothetical protein